MASITINVRLDDFDGMEDALSLLSGYIYANRAAEAKARHGCKCDSVATDDVEVKTAAVNDMDELDSAGHPWDPEKHSANKSKLKDGTWRLRRTSGGKPKDEKPIPPPPENATLAPEEISYKTMMDALKGKGLTLAQMNELAKQVGVDSIGLLIARQELIPAVLELVK